VLSVTGTVFPALSLATVKVCEEEMIDNPSLPEVRCSIGECRDASLHIFVDSEHCTDAVALSVIFCTAFLISNVAESISN
jgi:hypothetical protein